MAAKDTGNKTKTKVAAKTAGKTLAKNLTVAQKRAAKSSETMKKSAAKTQVRQSRKVDRAVKASAKKNEKRGTSESRWKVKAPGTAPQSARITAPKGPVKPIASKTSFAPTPTRKTDERQWLIVDATNQTVGRLASQVAGLLRGKHKATFTPNNDVGDFVVVINAEKVKFSANKETQKRYYSYSGYIGGMKEISPAQLREKHAERILESAVKGMISRNPLGRSQMKKLKIYNGDNHPHAAQNPVAWNLRYNSIRVDGAQQ